MLENGEVFAGFTVERLLGQGGMGTVYLARHPRLDRLTALKLLNRDLFADERIRARFEREADLAAGLDHPGIVTVYDRGTEGDQLWISMQYVDGVDAATVDPMTLPPERAVQIVEGVADALDFAHERGVLHRDVKPANILLARSSGGQGERVFLTDFGIARLRADSTHLTQQGMFTATLAYASPEQMTGAELDHRSDQYSLACALYWMFTGVAPFDSPDPNEIIHGTLYLGPPPLALRRTGLPPVMDAVLAAAMAKHPAARFNSCAAFATAARQALTSTIPPVLPHPAPNPAPPYVPHQPAPAGPFPPQGQPVPVPGYPVPPMPAVPQGNWQPRAPRPPAAPSSPPPSRPPAAQAPAHPYGQQPQQPQQPQQVSPPQQPPQQQPQQSPPVAQRPTDLDRAGKAAEETSAKVSAPGDSAAQPGSGIGLDSTHVSDSAATDVVAMPNAGVLDAENAAAQTDVTALAERSGSTGAADSSRHRPAREPVLGSGSAPQPDPGVADESGSGEAVDREAAQVISLDKPFAAEQAKGSSEAGSAAELASGGTESDAAAEGSAAQEDRGVPANPLGGQPMVAQPGPPDGTAVRRGSEGDPAAVCAPVPVSSPQGPPVAGMGRGAQQGPRMAPGMVHQAPWPGPRRPVRRRGSRLHRLGWLVFAALLAALLVLVAALVVVVLPDGDEDAAADTTTKAPSSSVTAVDDSFAASRRIFSTLVPQGETAEGPGYRGAHCVAVRSVSDLDWKEPALQWNPITAGWQCERTGVGAAAVSYLVLEYPQAAQARSVVEALPAPIRFTGDKDDIPFSMRRWVVEDPASSRVATAHQVVSFPGDPSRANYVVAVSRRGSSGVDGAPRPSALDEVIAWWEEVPL
ncbi:protein kinase domain-containing protein [Nocardia mangyaensis]|uniref:protein kinase domain-containing protein n=1 Tax=Nocardia mangyaensis TaxID=2213200 RepID=UPI002675797B|nr:protein kinase [Nocardia mangyaensis]MDO3645905.1 protein kinase [Nocardia mangyaensis]